MVKFQQQNSINSVNAIYGVNSVCAILEYSLMRCKMINEIKAYRQMIKEAEIEYKEKVECLREKIDVLTEKLNSLADSIAINFSNKFMPCSAELNLDYKILKLYINYNGADNGFFDSFYFDGWCVRIFANFSPAEKFDESEIAEWFKGILADYFKEVEND